MTGVYLASMELAVSASFPPPSPSYFMSFRWLLQLKYITKGKLWRVKKTPVEFSGTFCNCMMNCLHLPCHARTGQGKRSFKCSSIIGHIHDPLFQILQHGVSGTWLPHMLFSSLQQCLSVLAQPFTWYLYFSLGYFFYPFFLTFNFLLKPCHFLFFFFSTFFFFFKYIHF